MHVRSVDPSYMILDVFPRPRKDANIIIGRLFMYSQRIILSCYKSRDINEVSSWSIYYADPEMFQKIITHLKREYSLARPSV